MYNFHLIIYLIVLLNKKISSLELSKNIEVFDRLLSNDDPVVPLFIIDIGDELTMFLNTIHLYRIPLDIGVLRNTTPAKIVLDPRRLYDIREDAPELVTELCGRNKNCEFAEKEVVFVKFNMEASDKPGIMYIGVLKRTVYKSCLQLFYFTTFKPVNKCILYDSDERAVHRYIHALENTVYDIVLEPNSKQNCFNQKECFCKCKYTRTMHGNATIQIEALSEISVPNSDDYKLTSSGEFLFAFTNDPNNTLFFAKDKKVHLFKFYGTIQILHGKYKKITYWDRLRFIRIFSISDVFSKLGSITNDSTMTTMIYNSSNNIQTLQQQNESSTTEAKQQYEDMTFILYSMVVALICCIIFCCMCCMNFQSRRRRTKVIDNATNNKINVVTNNVIKEQSSTNDTSKGNTVSTYPIISTSRFSPNISTSPNNPNALATHQTNLNALMTSKYNPPNTKVIFGKAKKHQIILKYQKTLQQDQDKIIQKLAITVMPQNHSKPMQNRYKIIKIHSKAVTRAQ